VASFLLVNLLFLFNFNLKCICLSVKALDLFESGTCTQEDPIQYSIFNVAFMLIWDVQEPLGAQCAGPDPSHLVNRGHVRGRHSFIRGRVDL
jgi:hypothetical protein